MSSHRSCIMRLRLRLLRRRAAVRGVDSKTMAQFQMHDRDATPRLVRLHAQGGTVSSAALACVMLAAMTRAGPAGRWLHAALSAAPWAPLAELSYSAYLWHEQV